MSVNLNTQENNQAYDAINNYLNDPNVLTDPQLLLKACSKMQKHQKDLSPTDKEKLDKKLIPKLNDFLQNKKYNNYYYIIKASFITSNTKFLKDFLAPSKVRSFLRDYISDQNHTETEKKSAQLYKLAERIRILSVNEESLLSFIDQEITSSNNKKFKLNPIFWLANIKNPALYDIFFESNLKKLSLNETEIEILNAYFSGISPTNEFVFNFDLLKSLAPNACLEFLEKISHLNFNSSFFCKNVYAHILNHLDSQNVMETLSTAIKHNHKKLAKGCFDYIKNETGLILSFNENNSLHASLPVEDDVDIKIILESLSDVIESVEISSSATVNSVKDHLLKNNLPLNHVHSICLNTKEPLPNIQDLFPNAKKMVLKSYETLSTEATFPWNSIESLEMDIALTEQDFAYFKKAYPGLKIIFASCANENTITNKDNIFLIDPKSRKINFSTIKDKSLITDVIINHIVQTCKKLTFLSLNGCTQVTDTSITSLADNCKDLATLGLNDCLLITDAPILRLAKNCKDLTSLSLSRCPQITDVSIKFLAQTCEYLTALGLNGCPQITDASIILLAQNCEELATLCLNDCSQITGASIRLLAQKCLGLKSLSLKGINALGSEVWKEIGENLGFLKELRLPADISSKDREDLDKSLSMCRLL